MENHVTRLNLKIFRFFQKMQQLFEVSKLFPIFWGWVVGKWTLTACLAVLGYFMPRDLGKGRFTIFIVSGVDMSASLVIVLQGYICVVLIRFTFIFSVWFCFPQKEQKFIYDDIWLCFQHIRISLELDIESNLLSNLIVKGSSSYILLVILRQTASLRTQ